MFSNREYQDYIKKLKEIKSPGHGMVPGDFYLMKRFEILQVEKNGTLVEKLVLSVTVDVTIKGLAQIKNNL